MTIRRALSWLPLVLLAAANGAAAQEITASRVRFEVEAPAQDTKAYAPVSLAAIAPHCSDADGCWITLRIMRGATLAATTAGRFFHSPDTDWTVFVDLPAGANTAPFEDGAGPAILMRAQNPIAMTQTCDFTDYDALDDNSAGIDDATGFGLVVESDDVAPFAVCTLSVED